MRHILLGSAIAMVFVGSTAAQASELYNIELAGDSTAIGTLDWAGDLSSDGAFSRALSDINSLSITVAGVTFTAADEIGPFSSADYEVAGGDLVRFDATLSPDNTPDLFFGRQTTSDGGLSSDDWEYGDFFVGPYLSGTYTLTLVPEPSTLVLLTMSAVGLLAYGCRQKR